MGITSLCEVILFAHRFAERQGFEPWVPEGTTVFETAPIDHSGIFPSLCGSSPPKPILLNGKTAPTNR